MDAGNSTVGVVGRGVRLVAVALSLAATGCTMCPDPFDYAGPVPNGSVSQNDFAARSNGILPVRATPLPWPPVVQASPQRPTPADEPTGEPAMIAAAPDLSPVVEEGVVPVLGASLVTPVDAVEGSTTEAVGTPAAASEADEDRPAEEPSGQARTLWPTSHRRSMPMATNEDGSAGPQSHTSVRDSRLPRERPTVLLR